MKEMHIGPDNVNGNILCLSETDHGTIVIEINQVDEVSITPKDASEIIKFLASFADPRHL